MAGLRIQKRLPAAEGVAASSTAVFRLPVGFTYHKLAMVYANALADLTQIRVVANGSVIWRASGVQIDALNRFYGDAAASGVLQLHFDRRGMRTRAGAEATAIGTGPLSEDNPRPIQTLTVEVDLSATASPALSAYATVSNAQPAGVVKKVLPFTYTAGAAGAFQIADIPRRDAILAAHFLAPVAAPTNLIVEKNNYTVFERSAAVNVVLLADTEEPRTPQTNYFHFDPAEEGHPSEMLFTHDAGDLRFTLECAAGGSISTVVEYLGPVAG